MSTAAPSKPAAGGGGYDVARPAGQCAFCNAAIAPESKFMAALAETPLGFARTDCCLGCWDKFDRADVVAYWHAVMPRPEQKKKLFVDDTVLCELFERLAEVTEPAKVNFRFVLGLILMRKRLLVYEKTRQQDGRDVWSMRFRGRQDMLDMVDPKLDEQQMRDVSQQLGEILNQEL
ncbi:MAG: hypothetical protein ABSH20_22025 [Tepidisphaeraceae bacterium]